MEIERLHAVSMEQEHDDCSALLHRVVVRMPRGSAPPRRGDINSSSREFHEHVGQFLGEDPYEVSSEEWITGALGCGVISTCSCYFRASSYKLTETG